MEIFSVLAGKIRKAVEVGKNIERICLGLQSTKLQTDV